MAGGKRLDDASSVPILETPTSLGPTSTETSPATTASVVSTRTAPRGGDVGEVLRWIRGLRFKFRDEKAKEYAKLLCARGYTSVRALEAAGSREREKFFADTRRQILQFHKEVLQRAWEKLCSPDDQSQFGIPEDFHEVTPLTTAGTSELFSAVLSHKGMKRKVMLKRRRGDCEDRQRRHEHECAVLRLLAKRQHVVDLIQGFTHETSFGRYSYILMPRCGPNLCELVRSAHVKKRGLELNDALKDLAKQVTDVVKSLHASGVIWGNVQPANFVRHADNPRRLQAIDFDTSTNMREVRPGHRTLDKMWYNASFISPQRARWTLEMSRTCPATKYEDVWALGMVLYYIMCNEEYPISVEAALAGGGLASTRSVAAGPAAAAADDDVQAFQAEYMTLATRDGLMSPEAIRLEESVRDYETVHALAMLPESVRDYETVHALAMLPPSFKPVLHTSDRIIDDAIAACLQARPGDRPHASDLRRFLDGARQPLEPKRVRRITEVLDRETGAALAAAAMAANAAEDAAGAAAAAGASPPGSSGRRRGSALSPQQQLAADACTLDTPSAAAEAVARIGYDVQRVTTVLDIMARGEDECPRKMVLVPQARALKHAAPSSWFRPTEAVQLLFLCEDCNTAPRTAYFYFNFSGYLTARHDAMDILRNFNQTSTCASPLRRLKHAAPSSWFRPTEAVQLLFLLKHAAPSSWFRPTEAVQLLFLCEDCNEVVPCGPAGRGFAVKRPAEFTSYPALLELSLRCACVAGAPVLQQDLPPDAFNLPLVVPHFKAPVDGRDLRRAYDFLLGGDARDRLREVRREVLRADALGLFELGAAAADAAAAPREGSNHIYESYHDMLDYLDETHPGWKQHMGELKRAPGHDGGVRWCCASCHPRHCRKPLAAPGLPAAVPAGGKDESEALDDSTSGAAARAAAEDEPFRAARDAAAAAAAERAAKQGFLQRQRPLLHMRTLMNALKNALHTDAYCSVWAPPRPPMCACAASRVPNIMLSTAERLMPLASRKRAATCAERAGLARPLTPRAPSPPPLPPPPPPPQVRKMCEIMLRKAAPYVVASKKAAQAAQQLGGGGGGGVKRLTADEHASAVAPNK
ncbi:hypothetical protein JKP88DRAFT_263145 [Tribonema minus]|uniref:Protein kinase domain-containing protein n=1 Tax=Tribonema minus TaxID=303371 RepID=A0A835YXI9_9STRA|nr:hypothetical protein JKP88DRAFT_263145 [Tribonema minus]